MKHQKGFTLIELLVVVAIIALLLTIVMPSLLLAKEHARSLYCAGNMKQMCLAASTYALANDDYYPISYYSSVSDVVPESAFSLTQVNSVPPNTSDPGVDSMTYSNCWDFTTISFRGRTRVVPGVLWQGDTVEMVQQCPSYKGTDNWNSNPFTGYNYNTTYIGHGQSESVDAGYKGPVINTASGFRVVLPARGSDIKSPTSCALFGDGEYAGGANKMMRSPMLWEGDIDWSVRLGGTQGYRHRRQTNIGWADGHVDARSELYTDTHPQLKSQLDEYNRVNKVKIGFISRDNSLYDLK